MDYIQKRNLTQGSSYLIKDRTSERTHELFKQKLRLGFNGLCITRTNPGLIKEQHGKIPVLWLSSTMPNIDSMLNKTSNFLKNKNSIILLERIDYLLNMHGFEETLRFVYKLNDQVVTTKSILLMHINPDILDQMQLTMIEQELQKVPETSTKQELTDDLQEIIEFINMQKSMDKSISFKDITRNFNITKSTARKRINRLHNLNIIDIKKKGRFKFLSITQRYD